MKIDVPIYHIEDVEKEFSPFSSVGFYELSTSEKNIYRQLERLNVIIIENKDMRGRSRPFVERLLNLTESEEYLRNFKIPDE